MKKIWFFGDSATLCHGLRPGFTYYDRFKDNRKPTWTQLASEYFEGEELNFGYCGASSEDIKFRLITNLSKIQSDDVVFIQSTFSARINVFDHNNDFRPVHFVVDNETVSKEDFSEEQILNLRNFAKSFLVDNVDRYELRDLFFFLGVKKELEERGVRTFFWHHSVMDAHYRILNKWTTIEQESNGKIFDNFHLGFDSQKPFFDFLLSKYREGITSIIPSFPNFNLIKSGSLTDNKQQLETWLENLYKDIRHTGVTKHYDESSLYT